MDMSMDEFFPRTHKQHVPVHRENPARAQLQRDVEKFLAAGGKIQVVGNGRMKDETKLY
jgi:hypothetical protein